MTKTEKEREKRFDDCDGGMAAAFKKIAPKNNEKPKKPTTKKSK